MKKIFAISDIHGHYHLTIDALKRVGYDENNKNHLLIVCGDIFDRGCESLEVFEWLLPLTKSGKAVVLRGNHDYFLMDFLKGSNDPFNFMYNGLRYTLDSFLESTNDFGMYVLTHTEADNNGVHNPTYRTYIEWAGKCRASILEEYPTLLPWLESFPDYYETENYIFTHGSIDTNSEDWREPKKTWYDCHWDDGSFFNKTILNTDKTVVVGHFGVYHLRDMYNIKDGASSRYDILKRDDGRVIAIDTTTILSKRVNVLVIDGEKLKGVMLNENL